MSELVIPSLGCPFSLGMLYDAHSEKSIPGKSLWDTEVLDSAKKVTEQPSSNFEVYMKNTIGEKAQSLDAEASMKLSLMGGMIEVGGAAKYFNDEQTSERQARVTLKYSSTSRIEQLTMEQIGPIQYPKVLEDNKATHVVTGITYGTNAFFVFDRSLTETEKMKKVCSNMEDLIEGIPTLDMGFEDKDETDTFKCKFYGDVQPSTDPSTFEEAVKVCQELPKLIKGDNDDNENNTPKVIHLCPLSELNGNHPHVVRSISNHLISQIECILQSFSTMTMRANDLISNEICSNFGDLQRQIQKFQSLIIRFKINFTKELSAKLPKIREQGTEETDLAELIKSVQSSPFNSKDMEKYLKGKNKEIRLLGEYLEIMRKESNVKLLLPSRDGDLTSLASDGDVEYVACFVFNVALDTTAYVGAMKKYLAGKNNSKVSSVQEWFDDPTISAELRLKSSEFIDFVSTNASAKGFTFAVTDMNEEINSPGPAIILCTDDSLEIYQPPGKPGTPTASPISSSSVDLVWEKPETGAQLIRSYKIWFHACEEDTSSYSAAKSLLDKVEELHLTPTTETKCCISNLLPDTKYEFSVQAITDIGVISVGSDSCSVKTKEIPRPADLILKQSKLIEPGPPDIYKLPMILTDHNKEDGLYKYSVGRKDDLKKERVLMVLGATGAGKSTMINGLANYMLGVKFSDGFRFKVVTDEGSGSQANSQTKSITAYSFYSTIFDYTLTVIDTPGFGDTGGIKRDKYIANQIKMFFAGKDRGGIDVLHGIGFVAQASLARLTPTQKYIFDSVLSIFGKDIVDNIFLVATFADANAPQVLASARAANIPFKQCFKFNNSALFASSDSDGSEFNSMFWKMGTGSFDNFFVKFATAEVQSLKQTREVLKERERLETLIPGLQVQVKVGASQMDAIRQEEKALKFHEKSIMENKDFHYPVTKQKIEKVRLPTGTNTTTCRTCNFTCHNNCAFSDDSEKARCCAMSAGNCGACPNRCHWTKHSNIPYRFDYSTETVMKTYDAKKELHDEAESGKQRVERLLADKKKEFEDMQFEVFSLINQIKECNEKLRKIALKPNPLTETDYLELLIASEETEQKLGWKERVNQYKIMLKEAQVLKEALELKEDMVLKEASNLEIKEDNKEGVIKSLWNSFKSRVGLGDKPQETD